ncbi:hypothetical protein BT93_G0991 [Corymbia citriodora subsp. variegata]|nr:hypothetical protein BT93_G0991 [Corymbia citriodora subsp. variegata]
MVIGNLLDIHPTELKFTFELRRQASCSVQLSNKTDKFVAFKVKTTNPKKYCVRPNSGVVLPRATCGFTVTMQAPKEAPHDMQCRDKFLIQSIVAPYGATMKEITPEMVTRSLETPKKKSLETWSIISELTEEKTLALQQTQTLSQELDLLRREVRVNRSNSYFLLLSALVGLLGILVGYSIK